MNSGDYYQEKKWCEACDDYVRYLMSVDHSYCIDCGGRVKLFNHKDKEHFSETIQRHKWQAS